MWLLACSVIRSDQHMLEVATTALGMMMESTGVCVNALTCDVPPLVDRRMAHSVISTVFVMVLAGIALLLQDRTRAGNAGYPQSPKRTYA